MKVTRSMVYRFPDRQVHNLSTLLGCLGDDQQSLGAAASEVWYRGLPDIDYELLPTLHRDSIHVAEEPHLLNRFKQNAHEFLAERPQGEWEWMLTARHHGLPSRLLDWTESPLVGLYFSVEEDSPKDGALWCLLPSALNGLAGGATMATIDTSKPPMFTDGAKINAVDELLDSYLASRVSAGTIPALAPAAAISIRTNKRIQAQRGVFTIHHSEREPLEKVAGGSHLWRYVVPSERKEQIMKELKVLGVTRLSIYPELDNVAADALER